MSGEGEGFVNNRSLILSRSETCVTEIVFFPFSYKLLFYLLVFLFFFSFLFFSFLLFREEGKEETLSGIVSIRKGEKDGRESSPRVSKVVSVLHFRREMSGRRINRGNASSGYVTQTETLERRFPRVSLQFCFFFCKSSPISR